MENETEGLERVLAQLRAMPAIDTDAKARALVAVAAERERDRGAALLRQAWVARARWISGAVLLAAALVAAAYLRTQSRTTTQVAGTPASAPSPSMGAAQLANGDPAALEMAAQPVQFVLRAPAARRVQVVGDFNAWDKGNAPMVRDSASRLWSATLMIRPGRHVYAFVVDDSIWMRDPRAVTAPDADFGRPGSVLLVGRPAAQEIR